MRRSKLARSIFVWLDNRYLKEYKILAPILKKHSPSAIIVPSLGFIFPDVHLIKVAKQLKIPAYTIIISWDNTTTKGMTTIHPDHVFAWTEIMQNELVSLHGFKFNEITVSGVAHFDIHSREIEESFEAKYYKLLNMSLQDEYILVGLGSPTYQHEPNMETIEEILKAISNKLLPVDKLVVRLHPNYIAKRRQSKADEMHVFLARMQNKYKEALVVNYPYKPEGDENWFSSENDIKILSMLLRNSKVLVCFYSTLILEAALFDIPLVNISYDAKGFAKNKNNSAGREYEHIKRLFSYGAVSEVLRKEDLIWIINENLTNPQLLSQNRKKIYEAECGINKGKAGETLAKDVLRIMKILN